MLGVSDIHVAAALRLLRQLRRVAIQKRFAVRTSALHRDPRRIGEYLVQHQNGFVENTLTWSYDDNVTGWAALLGDSVGTDTVSPYAAPTRAADLTAKACAGGILHCPPVANRSW